MKNGNFASSEVPHQKEEPLYTVPDELRIVSTIQATQGDPDVGLYAGIAEVQLPAAYAIQNVLETERTRKMLEAQGGLKKRDATGLRTQLGYRSMQGGYNGASDRFAKPMSHKEYVLLEEQKSARSGSAAVPTVPLPGHVDVSVNAGAGKRPYAPINGSSGPGTSSDKRVMDEYKKRMRR